MTVLSAMATGSEPVRDVDTCAACAPPRDAALRSFAQAQAVVRAHCSVPPAEIVDSDAALGRVLASDVRSPVDLPAFANSAMDGFALCSAGATLRAGDQFAVGGAQAAGEGIAHADRAQAWEIMTGARLPDGLDTVVPVENVAVVARDGDGLPARIRLLADVGPGRHVRRAGEDIGRDALAIAARTWIGPAECLLLAGLGIASVPVARQPRVALLCTGRELVDDPRQALLPGQIRNANGPYIAARLRAAGAIVVRRETVPDDAVAFAAALERALGDGADMVLSTGAVSMGRHDFVPDALRALGARIVFHKVAMRPGKPLLFACLAGGQLYFGLPGNPVSSAVGLRFFVETALRAQLGLPAETGWRLPLAHAVRKKPGARLVQKAALRLSRDGCLAVALVDGQESFKTHALLAATAWALLPEDGDGLPAGTPVEVFAPGHEAGALLGGQQA